MARPPYSTSRTLQQMNDLEEAERLWNTGNPTDQLRSQKLYAGLGQKTYRKGQHRSTGVSATRGAWHPGVPGFPKGDQVGKRKSQKVGRPRTTSVLDPSKMGNPGGLKNRPEYRPEDILDNDGNPIFGSNPNADLKGTGFRVGPQGTIVNTQGYGANAIALQKALRKKGKRGVTVREKEEAALFAEDHGITGPVSRGRHRALRELGEVDSAIIRAKNLQMEAERVEGIKKLGLSESPYTKEAQERLGTAKKDAFPDIGAKIGEGAKQVGNIVTDFGTSVMEGVGKFANRFKPSPSTIEEMKFQAGTGKPKLGPGGKHALDAPNKVIRPTDFTPEEWDGYFNINIGGQRKRIGGEDKINRGEDVKGSTVFQNWLEKEGINPLVVEDIRPISEGGVVTGDHRKWGDLIDRFANDMREETGKERLPEDSPEGIDRIARKRALERYPDALAKRLEKNKARSGDPMGWWRKKPTKEHGQHSNIFGKTGETVGARVMDRLIAEERAKIDATVQKQYGKKTGKEPLFRDRTFTFRDNAFVDFVTDELRHLGILNSNQYKVTVPTLKGLFEWFESGTPMAKAIAPEPQTEDYERRSRNEAVFKEAIARYTREDGTYDEEAAREFLGMEIERQKEQENDKRIRDIRAEMELEKEEGTGKPPGVDPTSADRPWRGDRIGGELVTKDVPWKGDSIAGNRVPSPYEDSGTPVTAEARPTAQDSAKEPAPPKGWMESRTMTQSDHGSWSQNAFARIKREEDARIAAEQGRRPMTKDEAEIAEIQARTGKLRMETNLAPQELELKVLEQVNKLKQWHAEHGLEKTEASRKALNDLITAISGIYGKFGDTLVMPPALREEMDKLIAIQSQIGGDLYSAGNWNNKVPTGASAAAAQ